MDKIKLNLLPPEIKNFAKKAAKQAKINRISIGLLGFLIIATSGILAAVIFQGASLSSLNSQIEQEKARITEEKDTEAVVRLLKNRIDTINEFGERKYKQRAVFDLITGLFPEGVKLRTIQINRTPRVIVGVETDNTVSLQKLFDNLSDPKANEGKITSVVVESMNRSLLGKISFELTINLAEGVI